MKAKRLEKSETGDEEGDDIENRYKIIVPDAVDRFPVSSGATLRNYYFFLHSIEQSLIKLWTILGKEGKERYTCNGKMFFVP